MPTQRSTSRLLYLIYNEVLSLTFQIPEVKKILVYKLSNLEALKMELGSWICKLRTIIYDFCLKEFKYKQPCRIKTNNYSLRVSQTFI